MGSDVGPAACTASSSNLALGSAWLRLLGCCAPAHAAKAFGIYITPARPSYHHQPTAKAPKATHPPSPSPTTPTANSLPLQVAQGAQGIVLVQGMTVPEDMVHKLSGAADEDLYWVRSIGMLQGHFNFTPIEAVTKLLALDTEWLQRFWNTMTIQVGRLLGLPGCRPAGLAGLCGVEGSHMQVACKGGGCACLQRWPPAC